MKNPFRHKRALFIACIIIAAVFLMPIISGLIDMKPYNELLDADAMNVYNNGSYIGTFADPKNIMDTFNGAVGVGVVDLSQISLKRVDLAELYTLEFIKKGRLISTIEILAVRSNDKLTEEVTGSFRKFNGKYVVMLEKGYYFIFGQRFYDNLSRLLADNKLG